MFDLNFEYNSTSDSCVTPTWIYIVNIGTLKMHSDLPIIVRSIILYTYYNN